MKSKDKKVGSRRDGLLEKIEHNWLELAAAALLALATIMSAWSAYNSARWHASSTDLYEKSNVKRMQASESMNEAIQDRIIDVVVFTNYMNALAEGNAVIAEGYRSRLNPRLKDALDAWWSMNPLNNPQAPKTPFNMPQYKDEHMEESRQATAKANTYSNRAKNAMDHSNTFILLTVLFAGVLFFAGISTKFSSKEMKIVMLGFGAVLFGISVVLFLMQPGP